MNRIILSTVIVLLYTAQAAARSFMLACWIPYWKTEKAIHSAKSYCHLFDQVSPFSYEISKQGTLRDPLKRKDIFWKELYKECKKLKTLIIPTIYWADTEQMHLILSDRKKRAIHLREIMDLVISNKFDGINIDYECLCSHDREHYLAFLQELARQLHVRNLQLHICIEGRTSDSTNALLRNKEHQAVHTPLKEHSKKHSDKEHPTLNPGKGSDATRYKTIIAHCCDQIHIMGYGEWGRPYAHDIQHLKNKYYVSHASNQWVEQIIQYALTFIPPHKLVLGVPTYGGEFKVTNPKGLIRINKVRNLTYPEAMDLAHMRRLTPKRTAGGELAFTYMNSFEERYVCFMDAQAIKEKIELAKKYRIKGISIFTVSGFEDSHMWPTIEQELYFSCLRSK